MELTLNKRRYRFIERDFMFNTIKCSTEFLSDQQINDILDEHEWCDLTFIFDIRDYGINTIIHDNKTNCDVAYADLNGNAMQFYHNKIMELSKKDVLEYIRNLLTNKKAV
ncbi:hypothetical protein D3C74_350350 [compost metagenome]